MGRARSVQSTVTGHRLLRLTFRFITFTFELTLVLSLTMKRSLKFFAPGSAMILVIVLVAVATIWGVTRLTTASTAHAHFDGVESDTAGKYAQIKVEQDIHDFGNIELNTFAEHTFFI